VAGAAVSVTEVSDAYDALHVLPQAIPLGLEVTVPLPLPLVVTVRVEVVGALRVKVAVSVLSSSTTTVQVPVPAHAPLQPEKVAPVAGVAERARLVPPAMLALHVLPQEIPLGLEVTVPLPLPALPTVTVWRVAPAGAAQSSLEYAESPALL
jgi:hypothetical protein